MLPFELLIAGMMLLCFALGLAAGRVVWRDDR